LIVVRRLKQRKVVAGLSHLQSTLSTSV
jgi:hypothetical protein